jgi:hypothetical protein
MMNERIGELKKPEESVEAKKPSTQEEGGA